MKELTKEQKSILATYVKLVAKSGRHPTIAEMDKAGLTRNKSRHHFGTLDDLRSAAKLHDPKAFKDVIDGELFSPKNFSRLKAAAQDFKRFIVTTAVTGCHVHPGFLASLKRYCEKNKAMLLILPSTDPAAVASKSMFMDPVLQDEYIVFSDLALNKKIHISSIKLSAKHIDPITGLGRIGQRNGSFIYASPKQRLKMTPNSNKKLPHAMMTTGAITKADYSTERYMSERTAYIADHDHVLGAIIVEIRNDKRYHFRQIQADKSGSFVDLGAFYTPDDVTAMRPELLVLGDFHSGETDPVAKRCFVTGADSVTALLKPRRAVIHDGFNGASISHHEVKNKVLRAQKALVNKLSLQEELIELVKDTNELTELYDEIIWVKSNHDEFLDRYLAEGRYADEPNNHYLGLQLMAQAISVGNPLKWALEHFGLKHPGKIRWLDRDEDYKIAGIECGAHGDKGANGARGSLRTMESAYGLSVSGHSHTPEILRGAWQTGTLSLLKLEYNKGPSSWMHTSCLVYPNGMRQLINVIDGHWCLDDSIVSLDGNSDEPAPKKAGPKTAKTKRAGSLPGNEPVSSS